MPSSKTPECGMLTYHPTSEEYEMYREAWLTSPVWRLQFASYAIIEEKNSHLHIPFTVKYEDIGKKRERYVTDVINCCVGQYKNKEIAIKVTWPKKGDSFTKVMGYCLKGMLETEQQFKIHTIFNISSDIMQEAEKLMRENTKQDESFLNAMDICRMARNYATVITTTPSFRQFKEHLAEFNKFYVMNERTLESIYEQAIVMAGIRRREAALLEHITNNNSEINGGNGVVG